MAMVGVAPSSQLSPRSPRPAAPDRRRSRRLPRRHRSPTVISQKDRDAPKSLRELGRLPSAIQPRLASTDRRRPVPARQERSLPARLDDARCLRAAHRHFRPALLLREVEGTPNAVEAARRSSTPDSTDADLLRWGTNDTANVAAGSAVGDAGEDRQPDGRGRRENRRLINVRHP